MKAICVTPNRTLEVRDIPAPENPPAGHVIVEMDSATITHGDKFFLTHPLPGGIALTGGDHDVYGANGAGRVIAVGEGVPKEYESKQVAIYKSLARSAESLGVWSERALLPWKACLILPDHVTMRDYNGSFANVLTVLAFLDQIAADGHQGMIVTAGNSATGRIAVSLARRRQVPAIFLARSSAARDALLQAGAERVLVVRLQDFETRLAEIASGIGATAVFDGVGGELLSRVIPTLPMNSTVYVYGFLGAAAPISLSTMLLMGKNLTIRRFANLESKSVADPDRLAASIKEIEGIIDDPMFQTQIGKEFTFDQIDEAMAFETVPGARAVLVA